MSAANRRPYRKAESHIGESFGRLKVIRVVGKNARGRALVDCLCQCGNSRNGIMLETLKAGEARSCGCLRAEVLALPTHLRPRSQRVRSNCGQTPEARRSTQEKWRKGNPAKVSATASKFRVANAAQVRAEKAAYYQKNKRAIIDKINLRFATDPRFRVECLLRSRVRKAVQLQGARKSERTAALLGCSVDFFLAHIESLFTEGMDWPGIMSGAIHIDHKRPCSAFDLTRTDQQLECFRYSNLQPLWAVDNLRKSNILPDGTRARAKKL